MGSRISVLDVRRGGMILDSLQEGVVRVLVLGDIRVAAGEILACSFLLGKVNVLVPADQGIIVDGCGNRRFAVVHAGPQVEIA